MHVAESVSVTIVGQNPVSRFANCHTAAPQFAKKRDKEMRRGSTTVQELPPQETQKIIKAMPWGNPSKAKLIRRTSTDRVIQVADEIPLGTVYQVYLRSVRKLAYGVPGRRGSSLRESVFAVGQNGGGWIAVELLDIDTEKRPATVGPILVKGERLA